MATMAHFCPHEGCRKHSAFSLLQALPGTRNGQAAWWLFLVCPSCANAAIARVSGNFTGGNPGSVTGDIRGADGFSLWEFAPTQEAPVVPEHLGPRVSALFLEATQSRLDGRLNAAGMTYRKALEVALKELAPELKEKTLYARIQQLAKDHKLTPDLAAWAHIVRDDGNDAAHESETPTKSDADQLHAFTELLLTYLFTLPAQVKLRSTPPASPS